MAVVSSSDAGQRAIERGATVLQLRAPRLSARRLEAEARTLVAASTVPVVISGRVDIAIACGAAGVNLPEMDISVHDARRMIGDGMIGRSVHSLDAATQAQRDGADYVIFGPVWASESHRDAAPRGLNALMDIVQVAKIPVIAIGGVDEERARESIAAGASGYAAIRMFA